MNDPRLIAKELQLELSDEVRTLYFHGESMRPFLVEGDEMVVRPISFDEIRIGDVITYRNEDKFPTRRVVRKSGGELALWCENWPKRRFATRREDVLGRAEARHRDGSWITHHDREWRGARRRALLAYRWMMAREYLAAFPGRVIRKLGRILRREHG